MYAKAKSDISYGATTIWRDNHGGISGWQLCGENQRRIHGVFDCMSTAAYVRGGEKTRRKLA